MKKLLFACAALLCASASFAEEKACPAVGAALRPYVESGKLAGTVAIVVNPEGIVSVNCTGFADLAAKREMKPDTMFWIASMTKYFTATAFMMLWDEGKVGLDDPVGKYIPEMANMWVDASEKGGKKTLVRAKSPITMRQLLTHTSGLRFLAPCQFPTLGSLPLDELTREYAAQALEFQPGERFGYSNEGIDTIGRVIEIVSGMSYEQFLRTRILDPLGMKDTTFFPTKEQYARLATAYDFDKTTGKIKLCAPWLNLTKLDAARHNAEPGGGLFSTPLDIAKFARMTIAGGICNGKRFISEKALAEIAQKQCGDRVPNKQGFCCQLDEEGNWTKDGAFRTRFAFWKKQKIATVWMVQASGNVDWVLKAQNAFFDAARRQAGK